MHIYRQTHVLIGFRHCYVCCQISHHYIQFAVKQKLLRQRN